MKVWLWRTFLQCFNNAWAWLFARFNLHLRSFYYTVEHAMLVLRYCPVEVRLELCGWSHCSRTCDISHVSVASQHLAEEGLTHSKCRNNYPWELCKHSILTQNTHDHCVIISQMLSASNPVLMQRISCCRKLPVRSGLLDLAAEEYVACKGVSHDVHLSPTVNTSLLS